MNRPMCLTVLSMLASVAAAVAAPGEPVSFERAEVQRVAASTARRSDSVVPVAAPGALGHLDAPQCVHDVAAPYRQWHHGGLKLAPGCPAALRG